MRTPPLVSGFTIIELLIAMSVLALLVTLSTPMYNSIVTGNRTRSAAYALVSSLNFARSEAVKRNAAVSVSANGGGWQAGWEVISGADVLSVNQPGPNLMLSAPSSSISYLPNGRLSTPGFVLFTVSATTGYTRCVVIDPAGRATLNPGESYDGTCA